MIYVGVLKLSVQDNNLLININDGMTGSLISSVGYNDYKKIISVDLTLRDYMLLCDILDCLDDHHDCFIKLALR